MTALSLRGVRKSFGPVQALRGVDLDVPSRSLTAVLGPSGCGKTTLLRLLAGFDRVDDGTICFDGRVVAGNGTTVPAQRRRVGYVPQEGALFPHLDVAANIAFGLPKGKRRAAARIGELLELVGLDDSMRTRQPHQLSGGQQQRVALARALAPGPSLILLDEPFASLDASLRAETGRSVARALTQAGATALLVTHDQGEALSLADHVGVMSAGKLLQVDTPDALYREPATPVVAQLVGMAVLLPAVVSAELARCALGQIAVPAGSPQGAVRVLVRPEQIVLDTCQVGGLGGIGSVGDVGSVTEGVGGSNAAAGGSGRVTEISYYGHDSIARLQLAAGEQVIARVRGSDLPPTGSTVTFRVTGKARVFAEE